ENEEVKIEGPREQQYRVAIGACNHGAMYFATQFHRENMSIEQNVLLAFHCVAEAAKHDIRVDRPVDVLTVTRDGVSIYPESQLSGFVSRSEKITATISEGLSAEGLKLPET